MPRENTTVPFAAILVMAGSGARLGASVPKAFVAIGGVPLWRHATAAIAKAQGLVALIFVVPADRLAAMRDETAKLGVDPSVTVSVVAGGARRQDSVRLGLAVVPPHAEVVAVHDAARPLVTRETCEAVVRAAATHGAAIAAVPVRDTLKVVGADGMITGTVDRTALWQAQTPQAFRTDILRRAHEDADRRGLDATDDAQLVETMGLARVFAVRGDPWNFKVTEPQDTRAAEALLSARRADAVARGEDVPRTAVSFVQGGGR